MNKEDQINQYINRINEGEYLTKDEYIEVFNHNIMVISILELLYMVSTLIISILYNTETSLNLMNAVSHKKGIGSFKILVDILKEIEISRNMAGIPLNKQQLDLSNLIKMLFDIVNNQNNKDISDIAVKMAQDIIKSKERGDNND